MTKENTVQGTYDPSQPTILTVMFHFRIFSAVRKPYIR